MSLRFHTACLLCGLLPLLNNAAAAEPLAVPLQPRNQPAPVFSTQIPADDYPWEQAVEALLAEWEQATGQPIRPGETGRIALKVATHAGPGLSTPFPLVRALANALEERGFARGNIIITDHSKAALRRAGFLPPLSHESSEFEGMPVVGLDQPEQQDAQWYYDSPMPPDQFLQPNLLQPLEATGRDRQSFLPMLLLFDVDGWINLPVAMEHPTLGINGALANGSLWAVSNNARFFRRPVNAAAAAAEIAAIPELRQSRLFTILPLHRFQYIGGPRFNSAYTAGDDVLLLSSDDLILDRLALARLNAARLRAGFSPITPEPLLFRYGEDLDLGSTALPAQRLREVNAGENREQ